jgi:hypothetical protein
VWNIVIDESNQIKAMKKPAVILFLTVYLLYSETLLSQHTTVHTANESFKYTFLSSQGNVDWVFSEKKRYRPFKLSNNQTESAKAIIKAVSDSLHFLITPKNINTNIVDTLKHSFQIVSAIDKQGKIFIWVNAICDPPKDWRLRLIYVDDGGSCYYNFRIDLNAKYYFDIQVNSNA